MNQSKIFLDGEGNQWFIRNKDKLMKKSYRDIDFLTNYLMNFNHFNFLEIGCSAGYKLNYLREKINVGNYYGIDPSKLAIKEGLKNKFLNLKVGVAENLDYPNKFFSCILYSFCLYLVDNEAYKISLDQAINKITEDGLIAINDFDSTQYEETFYKHKKNVTTFRRNYLQDLCNLGFVLIAKESYIADSGKIGYSNDMYNRTSIQIFKKQSSPN